MLAGHANSRVRLLAAIVGGLILTVLVTLAPPAAAEEPVRMVFVLDSSGSMKEKTAAGEVKSAAATQALTRVTKQVPSNFPVGLRVFGAEVFSREDSGACTDSQLLVPVAPDNRKAISRALADYRPYGETPISYALEQGVSDVGDSGKRTIVLVSDGESTCDPDPCEVAGDLLKGTRDLQIDVVGLDVDGAAKDQLKCVASRGQGTYYDATNAETLANSLQTLQDRAARAFEVSGTPVTGTPAADQAPPLTEGDWTDELPPTGTDDVRHYRVYRKVLGSTMHVSASINRLGRADAVAVRLTTTDGTVCGTSADFRADDFGASILSAAVSAGAETGRPVEPACADATELLLAVRRADTVESTPRYTGAQTVPVELRVVEEKPLSTTDGLPAARSAPKFAPVFGDSPRSVTPGASFADAPTVKQGTYAANIVPGETQVFLVQQTWGQHINATVSFGEPSRSLAKQIGAAAVKADVKIFSPNRGRASTRLGGGEDFLNPDGALVLGATSTPVTYLNRAQPAGRATAYLSGSYAVVVSLGADPQAESYVVPYTLNLDLAGGKAGSPRYAAGEPAPPPPEPTPVPTAAPDGAERTGGGQGSPVLLIGGLAAALAAAGVGITLWLRRRRSSAS